MRISLLALAVALTASGPVAAQTAPLEPYKIGVTYPLSGPFVTISRGMLAGVELAVADINRKGGVKGHALQLAVEETQGTPQGGVAAMRKLVEVDGVQVVLTGYTQVVTAQIPLSEQLKVPILAPVEAAGVVTRGQYSFSHAPTGAELSPHVADFWKAARYKHIFAFLPNSAYGQAELPLWRAAAEAAGAQFDSALFDPGSDDFRGIVVRAKETNADAILVDGQGSSAEGAIVRALRELSITTPIFTASNNFGSSLWRASVGAYVEGLYLCGADLAPDIPRSRDFVNAFHAKTGTEPVNAAAETYDMVMMIAAAIQRAGYNGEALRDALLQLHGVPSVFGGTITMRPDHYTNFTALGVWQVRNGELVRARPRR